MKIVKIAKDALLTMLMIASVAAIAGAAPTTTNGFSHSEWNSLLKKYVSSTGKVNYSGFKKDKAQLNGYLKKLENAQPASWSRNDQVAFWINAYNAHIVNFVVQAYPIKSILDIHGGNVWDNKKVRVGGQSVTLNQIEKEILIGKYREPRIHFAINCAAKSCPPLMNKAWTSATLNNDLNRQTKAFINNSRFNSLKGNTAKVSKIFEWYAKDFGNVITFINRYTTKKLSNKANLSYQNYDWGLNN